MSCTDCEHADDQCPIDCPIKTALVDTTGMAEARRAKLNRVIIGLGVGNDYYQAYEKLLKSWTLGSRPPTGLPLGELPTLAEGVEYRQGG